MNIKSIFAIISALFLAVVPTFGQIQTKQSIHITVTGIPLDEKGRIDGDYPVGDSGTVNMPFIGSVSAAGLRPEALASVLQSRYKSAGIYRNPTFQVFATAGGSTVVDQMVTIGGQVRSPGPKKFMQGLTLWGAIQAAGGATEFGSMKRVKLTRGGKVKQYNVEQSQFMQIPLEPDDAIDVPQKTWIGN
jgi:protein involved in polysaccharide export with SLBB domain